MSPAVPELSKEHYKHLSKSGITDEVIKERGYFTYWGKSDPRIIKAGFTKDQVRAPGIAIPWHHPDGTNGMIQLRPDNPRTDQSFKSIKYESPKGIPNLIDCPKRCLPQIIDPAIPLWITEGAKKADALASRGQCALNCNGVWGWKAKNEFGASTPLFTDMSLVAWEGREVWFAFDADVKTNQNVRLAQQQFSELVNRKGAHVKFLDLPMGDRGEKTGVDDFLASGKLIEDLMSLLSDDLPAFQEVKQPIITVNTPNYIITKDGYMALKRRNKEGDRVIDPLCNFVAHIKGAVIKDDGLEEKRFVSIEGRLYNGKGLPDIEVPQSSFKTLDWVSDQWPLDARIFPGNSVVGHLRNYVQMSAESKPEIRVYCNTGWREVEQDGEKERFYVTPAGAIGAENVLVDLGELEGYGLPLEMDAVPVKDAVRCSLDFLKIGRPAVLYPLWGMMYSAPLESIIKHDFVLWYLGRTGSMKSVITALALCHYGTFSYDSLPLAWGSGSTEKGLMKMLSTLKDIPCVIDDWAPGGTNQQQNWNEKIAESVIRHVANKAKQVKLYSDGSVAKTPRPRGAVITSGEQLPSGESRNARLFVVDMMGDDLNIDALTLAQGESSMYSYAMANYIAWLANDWDNLTRDLRGYWTECRNQLSTKDMHKRLPGTVATLYTGIFMGTKFAQHVEVITPKEVDEIRRDAWKNLATLATQHSSTVNDEKPSVRFLHALRSMIDQELAVFLKVHQTNIVDYSINIKPHQFKAGWEDEEFYYLLPGIYIEVRKFLNNSDAPFTIKDKALWDDLACMGWIAPKDKERNRSRERFGITTGPPATVIPFRKSVVMSEDI